MRLNERSNSNYVQLILDTQRQVSQITALGVVVNDRMTASDHVTELLSSCTRLLYALCVLRAYGMSQQSLMDVFRATVESKLQYVAWSGQSRP